MYGDTLVMRRHAGQLREQGAGPVGATFRRGCAAVRI